ncbi:hypothetical protein [Exiguobacterium sp. SL-9]|uniref:hypothetical protein n=1 Tax=Exiguobacterium sp. SL-9 TaxID=2510963 RepID=UPI00103BDF08|nr:hypothetical protein [Exiguobacterium sp. SL-9]TCI20401.1 hypothetical protein EVJ34_14305 [Exiguobacterium sp. SL-9]
MIKIDISNFNHDQLNFMKDKLLDEFYLKISTKRSKLRHFRCNLKQITKRPVSIKKNVRDIVEFDFDFEKYQDDYFFYEYINFSEFYRQTKYLTNKEQRECYLMRLKEFAEMPDNIGFYSFDHNFQRFIEPSYFMNKINNNDNFKDYIDNELFFKIKTINENFKIFFDYDTFISPIRSRLLNAIGLEVCPYCNETLIHKLPDRTYADLDHFYSQSNFPLFTLSFNNFIPSCLLCNRTLKKSSITKIMNPRIEGFEKMAYFRMNNVIELLSYNDVTVDISVAHNTEYLDREKINSSIEMFDLNNRYNHSDVKKIAKGYFDKTQNNLNEKYREYIGEIIPYVLQMNEKEYIQYIFGIDFDETSILNNRLGKFKLDLINQLTQD